MNATTFRTTTWAAAIAAALLASGSVSAQTVLGFWGFNDNALPGGGNGYLADPDRFPLAADEGSAVLTIGGGIITDTIVNGNGDTVYQWVQSFAGTTINAPEGVISGGSLSFQGGTGNANNGAYAQFAFSMAGLSDLSVSYAAQRTSTGFNAQTWSWSLDGVNFTDFQTITTPQLATGFATTGVVTLGTLSALDGAASAFLRVTFTGATNATGNNRIDNVLITAVPAPAAIAMLALGGLAGSRRRR